ncbi:hypothetical protein [Janibacter sp. GXQ6167]|uniref:hypothetical protein n=1 Tax=Janibacter sp. GXQ6167 TaxID=3240791 RepID=UPI003526415C
MNQPSSVVAPGWWAFVAFFVLSVGLWLLMRSMFTRLRRMNLAEREREAAAKAARTKGADRPIVERARQMDLPDAARKAAEKKNPPRRPSGG